VIVFRSSKCDSHRFGRVCSRASLAPSIRWFDHGEADPAGYLGGQLI
jgi:hypothetical protein